MTSRFSNRRLSAVITATTLVTATALVACEGVASAADPPASASAPASASTSGASASAPKAAVDPHAPFAPREPRVLAQPDRQFVYQDPQNYPSMAWMAVQLLPSPELAIGRVRDVSGDLHAETAFGLRWQLSPLLWSWGTNRRVSRWRFFVVDPLARHSGSIELTGSLQYFWGHIERFVARPGIRGYFPLVERGEYLSMSLGTSTYSYDDKMRVAYDVGAYVLFGLFGIEASIAPDHGPLSAIGTFRIRYF